MTRDMIVLVALLMRKLGVTEVTLDLRDAHDLSPKTFVEQTHNVGDDTVTLRIKEMKR